MKKQPIIEDYYGSLYFIEENKDKELTIFIVDDNEIYLNQLKEEFSVNPKYSVHGFTTGEECLRFINLKPDLVILDYHLDGTVKCAQNGDVIQEQILKILPDTKVIIISADHKLSLVSDIRSTISKKVMYKDGYINEKIKMESEKLCHKKTWLDKIFCWLGLESK